jgi:DNA-binding MarR family transcriptional regulator
MVIAAPLLSRTTMNRAADAPRPAFTARQEQFLAFIHAYTLVNGRPPAEADMMRFFRLTPPSVHQMVLTLEKAGLISRQPGVARSIVVLFDRSALPMLEPSGAQPVKTSVQRY